MARRNKREERDIARERVERLVTLADAAVLGKRADRAARYCELAWSVKQRYQLRKTAIDGRRCRACGAFLAPGTMRVRLREGQRSVTCLGCNVTRRRPI